MKMKPPTTAERILKSATRLVQVHGFSAFSYAAVAAELGIRKASIHHHFPTKDDLGLALVQQYQAAFASSLVAIETKDDPRDKIAAYVRLYDDVLADGNRMCLCGMLAADSSLLPERTRLALRGFFDTNIVWLAAVLAAGKKAKRLQFDGSPEAMAWTILTTLEGAMLVARPYSDTKRFRQVAERLLGGITMPARSRTAAKRR